MKNRNRKQRNGWGGSLVLSQILMLLLIVIMSTMVFAYVATYVRGYQQGRGSTVIQRLLFEDVWFQGGQQITITAYGYGEVSSTVTTVFIDGAQYAIIDPAEGVQVIGVGESQRLTVTFPWSSGSLYTIKLLTANGYTVEGEYAAP